MANKAISELPEALNVNNQDLFVLEQGGLAKKLPAETFITEQGIINALAEALDGHGGISSVTLASVSGRIRTYRITFTDQSATTFQVYDGTSIDRIVKTSTAGLTDTYTVFMNDGSTTFFTVTNGADGTVSEAMLNDALKDKAPAITETVSGAIANFTDGADDLVMHNVIAEINPVQDLSNGDPSPTNICPISGHTEVNVTRAGKNLLWVTYPGRTNNGVTFTTNADSTISLSGTASGSAYFASNYGFNTDYMVLLKPATYTLSGAPNENIRLYGNLWSLGGSYKSTVTQDTGSGSTFIITEPTWFSPQIYVVSGTNTANIVVKPQIEVGSTATAYEPCTSTSLAIDWSTEAGTVYGGTIDVATGLLTVDRVINERLLSTFSSLGDSTNTTRYRYVDEFFPSGTGRAVNDSTAICNIAPYAYNSTDTTHFYLSWNTQYSTNRIELWVPKGTATTTPVQICAKLREPLTYQLTPQQLMTLLGTNNVWADTGNTSVTYPADTKMFIEKLTMPTEDDLVANQAITSGKYFMIGNSLYLALANIASGAQITIGTNAQRVSLADALNTINS